MNFNLTLEREFRFRRKVNEIDHRLLNFNQNLVKSASTQKDLGKVLGTELDFDLHLKNVKN